MPKSYSIVKVVDPDHELVGKVLLVTNIDQEDEIIYASMFNPETGGPESDYYELNTEQVIIGNAWVMKIGDKCYLNRRQTPEGETRHYESHGVAYNEDFPDSDFEPVDYIGYYGRYAPTIVFPVSDLPTFPSRKEMREKIAGLTPEQKEVFDRMFTALYNQPWSTAVYRGTSAGRHLVKVLSYIAATSAR